MWVEPNTDALDKLARAQMLQRPFAEIQKHAIEANTFRIGLDQPIYRIAELAYVEEDITEKVLTFRRVLPGAWNDPSENPLYDVTIRLPTGELLTLQALFKDCFATCWSSRAVAPEDHWQRFSYGEPAVRLRSTPRRLLAQLMHADDAIMDLRYFVGGIRYEDSTAMKEWLNSIRDDFSRLMDARGFRLIQSFMLLRSDLMDEKEVRLLCTALTNSRFTWWQDHIRMVKERPKVPFNWADALTGIELGTLIDPVTEQRLSPLLSQAGITCPITRYYPY